MHMRTLKLALLASVAVAGVSSAASAADLIIDAAPAPAVVDNYSAIDWDGPYAGLFLSGQTDSVFGLGANLGLNALVSSNLLVGGEASVQWLNNDTWQGQVHGKLGYAVENFAFYGLAGIGANSDTEAYVPVGVGAEVKLTEAVSLKAEYQYQWDLDNGADDAHVGKIGINFHF
jgi:opacity protein-like surface antigen